MPYRQPVFLFFALLLAVAQPTAWAQTVPPMLPYTGTIAVSGTPAFNGDGHFKFAIVNNECQISPFTGCASVWSNDLSKIDGSEPTTAVTIPVTNGVFAAKLGDTNLGMSAIPSSTFDNPTTFLRVWFSDDGTTFEQLSPDRQLVSVPYAFRAETADSVAGAGSIGSTQIDSTQVQLRVTGTCVVGKSIQSVNSDGTVVCETDDIGITSETDPTAITRQPGTPGTPQTGNLNITGTGIFGGNVGIGTIAPFQRLTVNGTIGFNDGTTPLLMNSQGCCSAGNRMLWAHSPGYSTWGIYYDDTLDTMYFQQSPNFRFLTVNFSGQVGIGTTTPDQLLSVNGNASKVGGGSWLVFSDSRLKAIQGRFDAGLKEILGLTPIRYRYSKENPLAIPDEGEHIGFSAQEVQQVIPDAVFENSKGYLMVNNDPILWAMLNAIKEQQKIIEGQEQQIEDLQNKAVGVETIKARLAEMDDLRAQLSELRHLLGTTVAQR